MVLSREEKPRMKAPPQGAGGMPPQVKMLQMMNAYRLTQSISVAAKLGIADLVADGPKSSEELAQATGTHAPSLYRLLRAIASFGIFVEDENARFGLTPRAAILQSHVPGSIRSYAIVQGDEWHWRMWGEILYSVKTGEPAFDHIYGMEFQDFYDQNPDVAARFDAAMVGVLGMTDAAITTNYDFSAVGKVVEVGTGGGDGNLLSAILKKNPLVQGIFFDLPSRIPSAQRVIEAAGLHERCETVAGDLLQSFPSGGEAYIIKNLVHDYDDQRAIKLLKNCHEAIAENGKVLVVEMIVPPGNEPSLAKMVDVEALIMSAGAVERTEEQYRDLLSAAGFRLTKVISTRSPMSIIEAVAV